MRKLTGRIRVPYLAAVKLVLAIRTYSGIGLTLLALSPWGPSHSSACCMVNWLVPSAVAAAYRISLAKVSAFLSGFERVVLFVVLLSDLALQLCGAAAILTFPREFPVFDFVATAAGIIVALATLIVLSLYTQANPLPRTTKGIVPPPPPEEEWVTDGQWDEGQSEDRHDPDAG